MEHAQTPIERAIKIAGGMTKLSRELNLTGHATVYQWTKTRVPAEHCPDIEALTGVRCEDLRPDVRWDVLRKSNDIQPTSEPQTQSTQGA